MLKPGGIYSIESIETNYWNTNHSELHGSKIKAGKGKKKSSLVEWFKDMIDVLNRHFFDPTYHTLHRLEHEIETLHFSHNILIAKKATEESSFKNSVYRYSDYVEGYGKNIVSEAGSDEIVKLLRDFL